MTGSPSHRYGALRLSGAAPGFSRFGIPTSRAGGRPWRVLEKYFRKISDDCTPAIASKMPYFVALVASLGARAIVVKMALWALGQRSPIRLPLACPRIVELETIMPIEGCAGVHLVVSRDESLASFFYQTAFLRWVRSFLINQRKNKGAQFARSFGYPRVNCGFHLIVEFRIELRCHDLSRSQKTKHELVFEASASSQPAASKSVFSLLLLLCLMRLLATGSSVCEPKPLGKHRPTPPPSILSPGESSIHHKVGLAVELSPTSYLEPRVDKYNLLQGGCSDSGISSLRSTGGGMYRDGGSGGSGGDGNATVTASMRA
ncbi:hypothetical protein Tco_0031665 [Tanacetum coccineum]